MATGKSAASWSTEDQAFWWKVGELLRAGEYEQLAEHLHQAQVAGERSGDLFLAHALAIAHRICLSCSPCQAEMQWHQRACEEAAQRERELRQQLETFLDLLSSGEPSAGREQLPFASSAARVPPERESPEALDPPRLQQRRDPGRLSRRCCSLGGSRPSTQPRDGEPRLAPAETRAPSSAEKSEMPPISPPVPGREAITVPAAEAGKGKEPAPPSLVVYCLGPFRVYQDDQRITDWPSGKGKCIFKYMIANRGRPIPKDILMDLFWRDADPQAARNNLNVAIYGLRQALRAARLDFSHILYQDDCYLLNPAMTVWVDIEEFEQRYGAGRLLEGRGKLAEAMRNYEAAEILYQGDYMEEDLYQDWLIPRREGLKDSYLAILDRLSRRYLEEQRYAACIHLCQTILAKDDCREDAHRRLMRCCSRQGQRNLALRQYHLCAETLAQVLDMSPMPETVALYHQIRRGEAV